MKTKEAKSIIIVLLLTVMIAMLINSRIIDQTKQAKQIAVVLKSKYGSEWELVRAGAKAAANEYGAELIILAPDYDKDIMAQKNLLSSIDKDKTDSIIVAPMESDLILSSISEVNNMGIPIMNIITGGDEELFYSSLTTNYAQFGAQQASLLKDAIGSDGRILLVSSEELSLSTSLKLEAIEKYLSENTTISIAKILYTQPDVFSTKRVCRTEILENSYNGIIALDGISTIGIANALREVVITTPLVGANLFDEELELVQSGIVQNVVNENFFAIGYFSIENTMNMLRKKGYISRRMIPSLTFDKDTMYSEAVEPVVFPIK